MCPSEWWCPALRVSRFICLPSFVSLHVSFWVVVSGSLGLLLYLSPFICLPSCVLLGGGVLSLHVSFWVVVVSGFLDFSLYLSPFISPFILPSFVSLHLSPFMCPSEWWCPALWVSRFIHLSPFICLPSFVSLHVSFWVVVSGSLGLSLYLSPFICLPSCVLLGGGVRLSGSLALFVSLHLSPFSWENNVWQFELLAAGPIRSSVPWCFCSATGFFCQTSANCKLAVQKSREKELGRKMLRRSVPPLYSSLASLLQTLDLGSAAGGEALYIYMYIYTYIYICIYIHVYMYIYIYVCPMYIRVS